MITALIKTLRQVDKRTDKMICYNWVLANKNTLLKLKSILG